MTFNPKYYLTALQRQLGQTSALSINSETQSNRRSSETCKHVATRFVLMANHCFTTTAHINNQL